MNNLKITGRVSQLLNRVSPSLRRVAGNTGWLMIDRLVRMGLGVFVTVWIARYLGPSRFGSLNFAISFIALFATLTTLGLENIVVKEVVLAGEEAPEILGTALLLRMMGSALSPLLAIVIIRKIEPHDREAVVLVTLLSLGLVFQALDTIDSYFQSQLQSKLTVWAKNSAFLLVAAFRIYLIHHKGSVRSFAVAQVAELGLGAFGLVAMYEWTGGRLSKWRFRKFRAIELLKQSWPVILSGVAIMIYMRIDVVMLKVMQGDKAVGIYAAATRVSEVWYFIPMAIVSSVSPAIIRARNNPALYYWRIRKLFALMTLISITIGSGIALSSRWIIHVLYADAFSAAASILAVHVWASVFVFLGVAQAPWDMTENLLKVGFYRTLAGAVSNVLLNLILIPRYSALGAAISTVVSYAISGMFANLLNNRTRPIFLLQLKSLWPTIIWESRNFSD